MPGRGYSARARGTETHSTGALEAWGGIVSGTVADFAEATGVHPDKVEDAAERVPLMVDTAREGEKGSRTGENDRTDDPERRCIALTTENAETLKGIAKDL